MLDCHNYDNHVVNDLLLDSDTMLNSSNFVEYQQSIKGCM